MRWIWIDKFMEFWSGQFARAIKNLTLAEAPQNPVMANGSDIREYI
jgi:hypothetical protein